MKECKYYVYAYIRSIDDEHGKAGTPYYIGKGAGLRAYQYHGKHQIPEDRKRIVFLESHLTNLGALALERRLIKWWGRIDRKTGILGNKTDGGDGVYGTAGDTHPLKGKKRPDLAERNRTMSGENHPAAKPGYKPPRLGHKLTEEQRRAMRDRWKTNDHPMLGKKHTDESRKQMSLKRKGVKTGKTWNKGIPASDETKLKLKSARAGNLWFNNGVICTMSKESPGDGWVRGRLWNN